MDQRRDVLDHALATAIAACRTAFHPGEDGPDAVAVRSATRSLLTTALAIPEDHSQTQLPLLIQQLRTIRDDSTSPEIWWRTRDGHRRYLSARRALASTTVALVARIKDAYAGIDEELLYQLHEALYNGRLHPALIAEEVATITLRSSIVRYAIASIHKVLWYKRADIALRRTSAGGGMWTGIPDHQFCCYETILLRAIRSIQHRASRARRTQKEMHHEG